MCNFCFKFSFTKGLTIDAEKLSNGTNKIEVNEDLIPEFEDGGNSLEQIFWKIGEMQWRVSKMKTRVHKVLNENASEFSLNENLRMLGSCNNSLTNSAENPAAPLNSEDKIAAAAYSISTEIVCDDSDTNMANVTMPESAYLRLGEVDHVQENIKSINPPAIGGSSKNV